MSDADAIVLGLGIHGSASAYEMASRGLRVIGIEQFPRGHGRGSSHGATRMIRRAYPSQAWNELVEHAYGGWERWERRFDRSFITRTGGVYAHRGESSMQGGRVRPIGAEEIGSLMPSLAVPKGYHAMYDPDAGVLSAALGLAAAQDGAVAAGAELSWGETVLGWDSAPGGVTVTTDRRVITADRLVVAGGAFVRTLIPELAAFFEVWRILTLSARPGQALGQPPALGSFSVDLPEGLVFGMAEIGEAGVKIGIDAGPVWDPATPVAPATPEESAHLAELLATFVPGVDLDGAEAVACLYTMTPDKRFVLGARPGETDVIIAAACSGHGFKFGPAIGEAVADLAEGIDRSDLDFLAPSRAIGA